MKYTDTISVSNSGFAESYYQSTKIKFMCGESYSVKSYPHLVTMIMTGEKCLVSDNMTGAVFTVDSYKLNP